MYVYIYIYICIYICVYIYIYAYYMQVCAGARGAKVWVLERPYVYI
jgi:hypothetical protein